SVLGKTVHEAGVILDADHLKVKQVGSRFDENVPKDQIVSQSPAAVPRHKLKEGSTVRVVVSNGPQPRAVPDLGKLTFDQATSALTTLGLIVDGNAVSSESVPKGQVLDWDHKGEAVLPGTHITLTYSSGPEQRSISDWRNKAVADAQAAFAAA